MNHVRKRLTYANVMSTLSVFLILGGASALAATHLGKNTVGSKQLKKESVGTAKIKKGAITGDKVNLSSLGTVPSATKAKTADSATSATTATTANAANTANSATTANSANTANMAVSSNPEAFAEIEGNGTVVSARSKGLTGTNVTHPATGVYCVTPPTFTALGAQASVQFGGTFGAVAQVTVGGTGNCPAPAVQVLTSSAGVANDFTVYVALYH